MNLLLLWVKKIKTQIRLLYSEHPKIILLAFLFLTLLSVTALSGGLKKPSFVKPDIQELKVLNLNKVTPESGVVLPEKISFFFSDEIDPHVFEHYLTISPDVPGKITRGKEKNQLDFTPTKPFPKGESYVVTVATGLTSKNGKSMLGNQVMNFSTLLKDNLVEFTKDQVSGKVFSFGANKPVSLKMRLSENMTSANVNLYKSTQAKLLNYLLYKKETKNENNYDYATEEYIKNYSEHNDQSKIDSFEVKNDQEKEFDLKPGVYYIEAVAETNTPLGSSFIIVNTRGVTFRQDDKKIVLSTFDIESGKKLSSPTNLGFYKLEDIPQQLRTHTYSEIETSLPFDFATRLDAVVGTIDNETVFIPVKLPESLAEIQSSTDLDKAKQIFLYTDRPLYKANDRVFFRGIVRTDNDGLYNLPPEGVPIRIWLGYNEKPEIDMQIQTDKNGIFSGYFNLPDNTKDTQYLYASTELSNTNYSSDRTDTYFEVATYTKPEFEIKTSVNKDDLIRGDKAEFTISANYFDGKPFADQEITYAFYKQTYYETEKAVYNKSFNISSFGGMCGGGFSLANEYYGDPVITNKNIKLDKNGLAKVSFSMPDTVIGSSTITLVATKKDNRGNEIMSASNTIYHGANYNIFFMPSAQVYKNKEEIVAPFYAETLTGEKLDSKEFSYKLVDTVYDERKSFEKTLHSGSVKTDDLGRGVIKLALDSEYSNSSKYLVVEGRDDKGNLSEARKYLNIEDPKSESRYALWDPYTVNQTFLKISSAQNNYKLGDKINLTVDSPTEIDALMSLERGRVYHPQVVHLNKGKNTVEVTVGEDLSPSITFVFSFFANGKYYTEGLSLNTPAMHKLMQINVTPNKNRYKPFETAQIRITTKDANSQPLPAKLSMGVIDKALLALKKNATPPIHSSFYYFRPRSTNASSSLSWVGEFGYGGRGGGGGGGGLSGQAVDTLYWNPNITTDSTGETIVPVPLHGFTTTWKAQIFGSSDASNFGQADAEFIVAK